MSNKIFKLLVLSLSFGAYTQAAFAEDSIHTENNEIVCQLDDFLETKIFVDIDSDFDKATGELSSKVIEMHTKNTYANNYRPFQVEVVKVLRNCVGGCNATQTILYKSDGIRDIINKLEVTENYARVTYGVDKNGRPTYPSFVSEGPCTANEVE